MTTVELIRKLRENPAWGEQGDLMLEAADRLEDLDERIDIMTEGAEHGKNDAE